MEGTAQRFHREDIEIARPAARLEGKHVLGDRSAKPRPTASMLEQKPRELVAAQGPISIEVVIRHAPGKLFCGYDLALSQATAEFDGKVETGH